MRGQAFIKSALFCASVLIGTFHQLNVPALSGEAVHRARIEEDATRRLRRPSADIVERREKDNQSAPQPNAQSQTAKLTDDSFVLDQEAAQVVVKAGPSPAQPRSTSGQASSDTDWNPWEGEQPLHPATRYLPDVLPSRTSNYVAPPANYGPYYAPPPPPQTSRWLHIQNCSCGTAIPSSACIAERTSSIYGRSYASRR